MSSVKRRKTHEDLPSGLLKKKKKHAVKQSKRSQGSASPEPAPRKSPEPEPEPKPQEEVPTKTFKDLVYHNYDISVAFS